MKDIDWSKAPEGATHYQIEVDIWYKQNHAAYQWDNGEWIKLARSDLGKYTLPGLVERPAHAEWPGQGLPPVGTVCEIRTKNMNDWSPATIKFAARNVIVWDWEAEPALNGLCTAYAHAIEIRPIRTPDQIAAEQAEREIDAICYDIVSHYENPKGSEHYLGLARALHLAGYRKQEQPK